MRMCLVPRLFSAMLVVLLLVPVARPGGQDAGKPPKGAGAAGPGQVEVRFANGSVVVMTLLQDKLEIQTEYGKLVVPPQDLRHVEFGVHNTTEEQRRIEDALRKFSSKAFREREAAVEELVVLGPQAYVRLRAEAKSEDAEVAKRVQEAIQRIRQKFHSRQLRQREEDVVRTPKFTIVGRILTPTIRAKAEEFGELELRPARLLSMQLLGWEAKTEVTIDAATFGAPGGRNWMDTGVRVEPHLGLKITAAGQVDLWPQGPGQYLTGPDGQGGGQLMGRIGDGAPFLVGSRFTQTPKEAGRLYLQIAPSRWGASAGQYRVSVTVGTSATDDKDD